jgi:hypothetical protein
VRQVEDLGLVCARSKLKSTMAQQNGHHDLLLGEEVASSTLHASRRPPSRVAARATPQRRVKRASVVQSVPVPNGLLVAARKLLRNPPDKAASPDAQRQWRDDVDASSTWHRLLQAQRGDLCPGNAVVRAAHPVLCCHHR